MTRHSHIIFIYVSYSCQINQNLDFNPILLLQHHALGGDCDRFLDMESFNTSRGEGGLTLLHNWGLLKIIVVTTWIWKCCAVHKFAYVAYMHRALIYNLPEWHLFGLSCALLISNLLISNSREDANTMPTHTNFIDHITKADTPMYCPLHWHVAAWYWHPSAN